LVEKRTRANGDRKSEGVIKGDAERAVSLTTEGKEGKGCCKKNSTTTRGDDAINRRSIHRDSADVAPDEWGEKEKPPGRREAPGGEARCTDSVRRSPNAHGSLRKEGMVRDKRGEDKGEKTVGEGKGEFTVMFRPPIQMGSDPDPRG